MLRHTVRTVLMLALVPLLTPPAFVQGGEQKPDPASEMAARAAFVKFDKNWKDYKNEPNYGDPRWKLKMETLVGLAKAGPAAFPLLEEAAKKGSKWSASTRQLAVDFLPILRKTELRKTLAEHNLAQLDSARVGKSAPDFTLKDAAGKTYRLSQFRGKIVVLVFIVFDL